MHARGVWDLAVGGYFLINIAILGVGILFERGRYHPTGLPVGGWQPTGERFVDHTSGKMVEVDYHSETGQRRYRDIERL